MKIELTTTKKKLTKSIVNQFRMAPPSVVAMGKPLGFVVNVVKGVNAAEIIECGGDYFFIPLDLEFDYNNVRTAHILYNEYQKGSASYQEFDTEEELENFWNSYQNILNNAGCQIYVE